MWRACSALIRLLFAAARRLRQIAWPLHASERCCGRQLPERRCVFGASFAFAARRGGRFRHAARAQAESRSAGSAARSDFPRSDKPGIYQVTLSEEAWIDVVQDDRYARSVGSIE